MKRAIVAGASVGKKSTAAAVPDIEDVWMAQLDRIREMRKVRDAAVDTMGCHMLADPLAPPEVHRFQVLLSLMLSSQTKDEITSAAIMRLRAHGCTVDNLLSTSTSDLEKLLHPVGFYKKKAVYIQKASAILKEKFAGDVPDTVEGLCSLPGVGPKMAHLVMQVAWGKTEGIAVDTHVHRIVNRLGWFKTDTPEQTRMKMQEMLPRSEWSTVNPLLVGFGQQRCLPVRPRCSDCLCRDICPSAVKEKKKDKGSKVKTDVVSTTTVVLEKFEVKEEEEQEKDGKREGKEDVKKEEEEDTGVMTRKKRRN